MEIAKLVVASVALTLALSFTVFAGTRRQGESYPDTWWYDYGDGQYPPNTWVWLDGNKDGIAECYYLDRDGWLPTDTTTPDGYQVNIDGQRITYDQIRRVYSTAATGEAVCMANDETYRPREAVRNYGEGGSSNEDAGKRVGGPESLFMQQTL